MRPTFNVKQTLNQSALMMKALEALESQRVLVGVPEDKAARGQEEEGAAMTNATLAYIASNGSEAAGIPSRPFLEPGIKKVQGPVVVILRSAAKEALKGNLAGVESNLNKAGLVAVNSVRGMFVDNDWPELAPATLAARERAEKGPMMKAGKNGILKQTRPRRQKGEVATPKRSNPLIFTGQLRKAVTFVVRRKGEK